MYWLPWIVTGLFLVAHDMASAATLTMPEADLTFHVPEGFSPLTAEEIAQAFEIGQCTRERVSCSLQLPPFLSGSAPRDTRRDHPKQLMVQGFVEGVCRVPCVRRAGAADRG